MKFYKITLIVKLREQIKMELPNIVAAHKRGIFELVYMMFPLRSNIAHKRGISELVYMRFAF